MNNAIEEEIKYGGIMSKKENGNRKFRVILDSCTPEKLDEGKWTYSFSILPELSFFWLGGLQYIYISWCFWNVIFEFKGVKIKVFKEIE